MRKILDQIKKRKFLAAILAVVIIFAGYSLIRQIGGDGGGVRYVTAQVERGTLISSVSGSGQVSISSRLDLKPGASGYVVAVNIKSGQEVKKGDLLVQLNALDVYESVRDAEANLESAKLSLEKLLQPATDLEILRAENDLAQAEESKVDAENDLEKAYEDGFNVVADAFLDLPSVMSGLEDILYSNDVSGSQSNVNAYTDMAEPFDESAETYEADTIAKFQVARAAYENNFQSYKSTSRFSDEATIGVLMSETYETTKVVAEAVKGANNLIDFVEDILMQHSRQAPSITTSHQNSLDYYTSTTNSHLTGLSNKINDITDAEVAILNAGRDIAEKAGSLAELKAGADELDIRSQELTVRQRENSLLSTQSRYADYVVRAPFDGIVAEANVRVGEMIGSSTVAATVITTQKIAEVSLNEVDITKVEIGHKTTITFDAIEDFSLTGEVVEVDTLGTVTQGVVNFDIKIVFDTQDERIKPGMSMSTTIITDVQGDVLMVPSSAIKYQGESQYVELLVDGAPRRQSIETGVSNDLSTEITSGLDEGQAVITQTVQNSSDNGSSAPTGGMPGMSSMGGAGRAMRSMR